MTSPGNEMPLGVRAGALRDDLRTDNARLLEYVRNGGVVMVEYNTPEFGHNFGSYTYVMTNATPVSLPKNPAVKAPGGK